MNRKGFTLIELLAVIIVLALVLVVTIPSITTSINNNKLSALHTLSKEVAKWYDETVIENKLSTNKVEIPNVGSSWQCLGNISSLYGLSPDDIVMNGAVPRYYEEEHLDAIGIDRYCSAIRVVNGSAEVLLIGRPSGKYSKGGVRSYALSTDSEGHFDE